MSHEDAKKFHKKDEQSKSTKSLKKTLGFDVFIEELEKKQKEKDNG